VAAAVAQSRADEAARAYHVDKLLGQMPSVMQQSAEECELLYGRAGYLYALLFAFKYATADVDRAALRQLVSQIIQSGQSERHDSMLMGYQWHGKAYLGAAHGIVGIMHTLLLAEREFPGLMEPAELACVLATLSGVLRLRRPNGNIPSSIGSQGTDLVHWCHGAPGLVMALLLACAVAPAQKDEWLPEAKALGDVVWERGLLKKVRNWCISIMLRSKFYVTVSDAIQGVGMCHGIAGNAYTFLALYRATGDEAQLLRAKFFAAYGLEHLADLERQPDHPFSLFEGRAALAALCSDLVSPGSAFMLGYELG
jgi:lantibiotic modifying enzyme